MIRHKLPAPVWAAMVQARAAWNALSPEEQELSENNTTTTITAAPTYLAVYEEHPSWDIVDIAKFARDRPQRRHTLPTAPMKAMMQQWHGAPTSPVLPALSCCAC
jgi:hypothetical protein